ncbi:potassium channel subfamily T member 2-like isoform X2 [Gigantopelta aegis]|uniref:potassium channel subfamily T member 2-like isoform X2 n=1 Tax=Gigantopelta aegis TaxID=1735272 RepID=UPI001B88832D|nr:potassium channel subfamily T member 2-like isoform X2 [Gigantopelta aegis]
MEGDDNATDCDGIDLDRLCQCDVDDEDDGWDQWDGYAPVKYFTYELSVRGRLRRLLVKNPSTRLYSTLFDLVVNTVLCSLYVTRVCLDNEDQYRCHGQPCTTSNVSVSKSGFSSTAINWYVLLWVYRPLPLWIAQILLSVVTLVKASLQVYVMTKGTRRDNILHFSFLLELFCSLSIIVTAFYPVILRHIFVPTFIRCWLAKRALQKILNDLHLTKQRFQTISVILSQQMLLLNVTLFCLIFTTVCGIQHIQRGSDTTSLSLFESVYFVIVTFSTVGYGDISPDIWLGQLFMFVMICVAFAFIPRQLEQIATTWIQRKRSGGEFSRRKSRRNKHVVVCSTVFTTETIMNFLNEFYAHPKLEEHTVVLLSSQELDTRMQMIFKDPKWANRVVYIRGSVLKDIDLKRCRISDADACFFLGDKQCANSDRADQHSILRSWAVKDFAPKCQQYIQLFKTENKMHVKFAEHVVCEDEFKYALLANNCLYPGLSTLVMLLLHTSRGREGEIALEPWQQVYGRHSGNEIYHIQLGRSTFFRQYDGKSFTTASANAHQRFGISLVAVLDITRADPQLQLNPGPDYILKSSDYCFYMGVTREEYSKVSDLAQNRTFIPSAARTRNIELIANEIQKWLQSEDDVEDESLFSTITSQLTKQCLHGPERIPLINLGNHGDGNNVDLFHQHQLLRQMSDPEESVEYVTSENINASNKVSQIFPEMAIEGFTIGSPPCTLYIGSKRTLCHLHINRRPMCCTEWGKDCEHVTFKNANDERWDNQLVILTAQTANAGIYNFIVPLRSSFHSFNSLSPIILLLEQQPEQIFLETIAHFPFVFWMQGKMTSIDDLLVAGINKASHIVIANRESDSDTSEERLVDAEIVVAVHKIYRLFPNANVITELNDASNMRFMQFEAHDAYTVEISKLEKKLKEQTSSNLPHLFRLPFAAGHMFSASMLDGLLYQTFVKGYLISFLRLMLGIDAQENSGHLSSVRVQKATVTQFPTYGDLYIGLCSTTGEIPIAIYRTEKKPTPSAEKEEQIENNNIRKMKGSRGRPSLSKGKLFSGDKDNTDILDLIASRLKSLNMHPERVTDKSPGQTLSYVIVNPSPKRKLRHGDIIYVIQPSHMCAVPNKLKWNRSRKRVSSISRSLSIPRSTNFKVERVTTPTSEPTSPSGGKSVSWNDLPKNADGDRSATENKQEKLSEKFRRSAGHRARSKSESLSDREQTQE